MPTSWSKSVSYLETNYTLQVTLRTGTLPSEDNNPLKTQYTHTITSTVEEQAPYAEDGIVTADLAARIAAASATVESYIDSDTAATAALTDAGFTEDGRE